MTLYLLFSHRLTEEQIQDAQSNWKVERFIYLPENLQELWSNIPPELPALTEYLTPIFRWIEKNAKKNDLLLIQGDFGATCLLVQFAWKHALQPIYSTTTRTNIETIEKDGSIRTERFFVHQRFRLYEKI